MMQYDLHVARAPVVDIPVIFWGLVKVKEQVTQNNIH